MSMNSKLKRKLKKDNISTEWYSIKKRVIETAEMKKKFRKTTSKERRVW